MDEPDKKYKQIKIVGFILFIPLILFTGPMAGYIAGDFLARFFKWAWWVPLIGATIGFLTSVKETVRIIRIVLKMDAKS
jgi:hypothetical protein